VRLDGVAQRRRVDRRVVLGQRLRLERHVGAKIAGRA
jgi:hypothetical protein